jgi:ABC-type bacteriocin/lantibiotic exporter with double-glycine peptidase domain
MGSAGPTLALIQEIEKQRTEATTHIPALEEEGIFHAKVILKDVCVQYRGADEPAVKDFNLEIIPGEFLAITGPSGSGKSTLVDAMLGIIPIKEGSVTVSGLAPGDAIKCWPGKIGYVPQNVSIVPGTILENIALGFPTEEISEESVWSALEVAKLSEFVNAFPDKLRTRIGDGAFGLSGGQRQRLGIARALYSKPELLILDEATSALDSSTEKLVTESLESLHGAITTIVIAHRLSTVMSADRIVLLEDGMISGVGNFEELRISNENFLNLAKNNGL